jgi:hypothetical protein
MSKIILEFDADTERDSAELAQKAGAYRSVIMELDNWLRQCLKYNAPIFPELGDPWNHMVAEGMRAKIHELCEEHEVSLW